jgi:hypothetical protein
MEQPSSSEDTSAQRASDAERDEVAAVLGEAMAQGRLTSTELAERIDATYSAKTRGDLEPLTRDLPTVRPSASAVSTVERQEVSAVFSKVIRRGRWVAGRHTELHTKFGALIVDLSEAVLPGREITLEVDAFFGKAIITVPENARIIDEGSALFGKRMVSRGGEEDDVDGPLIRLTGRVRFGKVVIRRPGSNDWHNWQWNQR